MIFVVGSIPFYSAFVGFLVYYWFPPFAALGTRTNVVLATLVVGPFLIFSLFSTFEIPPPPSPKSSQLTFLFWEVLGLTFNLLFPKLRCYFSDSPFWLLHLLSFSLNGQIPFCQVERSPITFLHGQPPCIARDTRLPLLKC